MLLGLLLTNGPGTISAQGAKGAVPADGPESPERVQLNKAMVGFLTHSGFATAAMASRECSSCSSSSAARAGADPGQPQHGLDLTAMATAFTTAYKQEKAKRKEVAEGGRAIPGINHPVFRGKPVNTDPREVFVRKLMEERGESNVFHDYYHAVARALFDQGVTATSSPSTSTR